jgi:hypothetical protein
LPIDEAIEPEIECDQGRADDKDAGGYRKKISALERARK